MRAILTLVPLAFVAACVPRSEPPPPAPPTPTPAPAPVTAPPPPPPASADWRDWPVASGDWVYRADARGSVAMFGVPGNDAQFVIRCDRPQGQVYLSRASRPGMPAANATVRTDSTARTLAMQPTGAQPAYLAAALAPRDGLLDAMGFSRGRFVIEVPGMPALVVPTWPELTRVVDDCRR